MRHANMVRDVVSGLWKFLKQEQVLTENTRVIESTVDHVVNAVQNTQQQLSTKLQQMQVMMQSLQMKYASGPQNAHQNYGGRGYPGGHASYCGKGGHGAQRIVNWRGGRGGRVNRDLTHYCWTHGMCDHPSKD